jgi:hypothetical protein
LSEPQLPLAKGVFFKTFRHTRDLLFSYSLRFTAPLGTELIKTVKTLLAAYLQRPHGITFWRFEIASQAYFHCDAAGTDRTGTQILIDVKASELFERVVLPEFKAYICSDIIPLIPPPEILTPKPPQPPRPTPNIVPLFSEDNIPSGTVTIPTATIPLVISQSPISPAATLPFIIPTPDTQFWRRFLVFRMLDQGSQATAKKMQPNMHPLPNHFQTTPLFGPLLLVFQHGRLPYEKIRTFADFFKSLSFEPALGYDPSDPSSKHYAYQQVRYAFYQQVQLNSAIAFDNVWILKPNGKAILALFRKFGYIPVVEQRTEAQVVNVISLAAKGEDCEL